ncbi:MAG: hypothetical protein ACK2UC_07735 [Anaerolineae bacterium]
MKRRAWVLLLILLLAVPFALLLRDFVREELAVELLRLLWAVRLLYESLPQLPIWLAFLAFALVAALGSLLLNGPRRRETERPTPEPRGRVHALARWIRRASEGEYFRWRLAQHLGALTWEVMAYRHHVDVAELERGLGTPGLQLPPAVQDYLQSRDASWSPVSLNLLARLRHRLRPNDGPQRPDPGLEAVVSFLEEQMEVEDGRRKQ